MSAETAPDDIFVHTAQLDAALRFLGNESVARCVKTLCIDEHGRPSDPPFIPRLPCVDDDVFVELVTSCPNIRTLKMRNWDFEFVRPHLLSRCLFSRLSALAIGWDSTLTLAGFFALLSMMPALKRLVLGSVENAEDGSSTHSTPIDEDENLATPACSLTHLGVSDDWDINFVHYPLLLSRSHDTLEHVDLQWIYCDDDESEVAKAIVRALERCTRVRHLSLMGNDFPSARIIAACPRVCSLTLLRAPSDGDWAALRAPLRALELANCYGARPDAYVAEAWAVLRERVPQTPVLGEIRFNLMGKPLLRETSEYREMRRVCRERRIHLALCGRRDTLWI